MKQDGEQVWYRFKQPIVDSLGISRDALHVHLGLFVFLLVAIASRSSSKRFWYAWLAVLAAETANELLDFHDWYRWTGSFNWRETVRDYAHTMLWPSVLLALLRFRLAWPSAK